MRVVVVVVALCACADPPEIAPACKRAEGYATRGVIDVPATVRVAESSEGALVLRSGDAEVSVTYPEPPEFLRPAIDEELELARFSDGGSDELGVVTGEVAFVPGIELRDDAGIVLAIDDTSRLVTIVDFEVSRTCSERGNEVGDAEIVLDGGEAEARAVSDQVQEIELGDPPRAFVLHVLDAFVVEGNTALASRSALFRARSE